MEHRSMLIDLCLNSLTRLFREHTLLFFGPLQKMIINQYHSIKYYNLSKVAASQKLSEKQIYFYSLAQKEGVVEGGGL